MGVEECRRHACSDEINKSLSISTGGRQFVQTEVTLLKKLAVRYQNPAVHVLSKSFSASPTIQPHQIERISIKV